MALWQKNTPDGTASAKVTVYRGLVLLKSIKGPEGQWKQGGEHKAPQEGTKPHTGPSRPLTGFGLLREMRSQ